MDRDLKKYVLDASLHHLHKEGFEKNDFGMDNSSFLIDGGFGLYSTANSKTNIGPIKAEYYRIGLVRSGHADFTIGLESFRPGRNYIVMGFPGQIFSFHNPSTDFFTYYMLFSEKFIAASLWIKNFRNQLPFLKYDGVQCFEISEPEAIEVEGLIFKINEEVKSKRVDAALSIQLYIQFIYLLLSRSYARTIGSLSSVDSTESDIFTRFLKLVSEHFLSIHKVSDYAKKLHLSADHLTRIIKSQSTRTARELIDEMRLREAKAYLLYSPLTVSEIAFKLNFSSSSHFIKFFKKLTTNTPIDFRKGTE